MRDDQEKPVVLVLSPMPAAPASAGNRRRLVATCEALRRGGFAIDLAYYQHEDQVYRRFGQHPPTDVAAMTASFRRTFLIPAATPIPLKTWSGGFPIDAWCPDEVVDFVAWYCAAYPGTGAVLVNYVFLSRALEAVPAGVLRLIDTHDRFAGRNLQYRPFRTEPNFFYTDAASEAYGLARADIVLAIQASEAAYFRGLTDRDVRLLPPLFPQRRPWRSPSRLATIGFVGHSNDPNLFSIGKFAHAWSATWRPGFPTLVVAGEICSSFGAHELIGVQLAGYVTDLDAFYDRVDAVVAPMVMGSGLKMKVGEALAMGKPVIGTRIAFEGFDTSDPGHCLDGVDETVATVLRLRDDAAGLRALTDACSVLLSRYNAASEACESEWLAALPRRRSETGSRLSEADAATGTTGVVGRALVCEELSLRSLAVEDDLGNVLVATENPTPDAARTMGYTPQRRRWFAREASTADEASAPTSSHLADLRNTNLEFSPEWVHGRRLPRDVRESLSIFFGAAQADWTALGSVVGSGPTGIGIACAVPSFLATGRRDVAAFLLEAGGKAREMRITGIAALARSTDRGFTAKRTDLTPIPAVLTLAETAVDSVRPIEWGEPFRARDATAVLLLSDSLFGRLDLTDEQTVSPKDDDARE